MMIGWTRCYWLCPFHGRERLLSMQAGCIESGKGSVVVTIYDYADREVPMLTRMLQRRLRGYKQLGYRMDETEADIKPDENAGYYSDGQTTGVDCPS
jgi:hypothetical protein